MKNLILIFTLVLMFSACRNEEGSGNMVTQQRQVEDFNKLSVGGGFVVELTTGAGTSVTVIADDNVIEDIRTSVQNGELIVSLTDGLNVHDANMTVRITVPALERIKASASAEVKLLNELRSDQKLHLDASSAASISGNFHVPDIEAEASSGAELDLAGQTKTLKADASSGASINAFDLLSEIASSEASSGSSTHLHASVQITASASSGASIRYRGGAKATINESSGGSVEKE